MGVVVAISGATMLASGRCDHRGSRSGPDSAEVQVRRRVGGYQLCFGTALALSAVAGALKDRDAGVASVVLMGVSLALAGVAVVRAARTARRERQSGQGAATEVGLA